MFCPECPSASWAGGRTLGDLAQFVAKLTRARLHLRHIDRPPPRRGEVLKLPPLGFDQGGDLGRAVARGKAHSDVPENLTAERREAAPSH